MTEPPAFTKSGTGTPPPPPPTYATPPAPPYPVSPAPVAQTRPNVGAAVAAVGIGLALVSAFGLPAEDYGDRATVVGYTQLHDVASQISGQGADLFYGGFAQTWWDFGLLVAVAAAVVLTALVALRPIRALGWVLTGVAVAIGVLHAISLAQTTGYVYVQQFARNGPSIYEHAGLGVWLSFVGFGVLAVGGLVTGLTARTRPATPPPIR